MFIINKRGVVRVRQEQVVANESSDISRRSTRRVSEGKVVEILYLDFSKTFDLMGQFVLECKLSAFNIAGSARQEVVQSLSNCSITAHLGNYKSDQKV